MRWGDSDRNASKAPVLRATSMLLIVDVGTFEHIVSDLSLGNVLRRLSEMSLDPITHSMMEMHHNRANVKRPFQVGQVLKLKRKNGEVKR